MDKPKIERFPGWRYHRSGVARIVRTAEEDGALMAEGDWADTPAAFAAAAEARASDAAAPTKNKRK